MCTGCSWIYITKVGTNLLPQSHQSVSGCNELSTLIALPEDIKERRTRLIVINGGDGVGL